MYEQTAQSLEAATERLRGNPHPGQVWTWRTARKSYRCDGTMTANGGYVEARSRYLEVVVLTSDIVQTPARFRYCAACGGSLELTAEEGSERT